MTAADSTAVSAAINLGWRLAELYNCIELPSPASPTQEKALPLHLPGIGEMSAYEKAVALIDHVDADLQALNAAVGGDLPAATDVRQRLDSPGHARDDVRKEVLGLYLTIRNALAGSAPLVATAFGLGRMLADTALRPTSKDGQLLPEQFDSFRLSNAHTWLDDLENALPKQSAAAVQGSLAAWEQWVADLPKQNGQIDSTKIDDRVVRALHRQGEMWRRLLAGEKDPTTLLRPDDYVEAAERLVVGIRKIAGHFLWSWIYPIIVFAALVGISVWVAVAFAPAGSARVAAVLVSAAGALGLSWKGVEGTLGKAVSQAESVLWNAEVSTGVVKAATILPPTRT